MQLFFLSKYSSMAPSLLLISRVLKKLILTVFASVPVSFMEWGVFGGPWSAIFPHFTLCVLHERHVEMRVATELI